MFAFLIIVEIMSLDNFYAGRTQRQRPGISLPGFRKLIKSVESALNSHCFRNFFEF